MVTKYKQRLYYNKRIWPDVSWDLALKRWRQFWFQTLTCFQNSTFKGTRGHKHDAAVCLGHSCCRKIFQQTNRSLVAGLRSSSYFGAHFRVKRKLICCQPADYRPDISSPAGVMETRSAQENLSKQICILIPLSLSLFDNIWGLLWSRDTGSPCPFKVRKPRTSHKFVFRMTFTVERSSIVDKASQRGN